MKHLAGRLESLPLSGPLIQSVFDHRQLLIGDRFLASFLGNVLAQQTIEVLVAAALSAPIRICKVDLDAKGLIDGLLVSRANDRVTFSVAHLLEIFIVAWSGADRAAIG